MSTIIINISKRSYSTRGRALGIAKQAISREMNVLTNANGDPLFWTLDNVVVEEAEDGWRWHVEIDMPSTDSAMDEIEAQEQEEAPRELTVEQALEMLGQSSVDVIYLVDSYGSLYPEQVREYTEMYCAITEKYGKKVGMHAHNNQQMAFANTVEAVAFGASYLDATMMGMGRGAGNCILEGLLGFLRNPRYNIAYVLKFIQTYMLDLKKQGLVWGYDIPYLLTGLLNRHPKAAIDRMKEDDL